MKKYILTSNTYYGEKNYTLYGIAYVEETENQFEVFEEYASLSNDMNKIKKFVQLSNELRLDLIHLRELVDDILNTEDETLH